MTGQSELDVNLRRFQAEVSQIVRHMEQWERTDHPPSYSSTGPG